MSILLTDLVKYFGDNLVVNKVFLEVQEGELFVLLGGSGSGKSTILRLIAGLILPNAGRIELNGRDVTFLSPQARETGFVFQNYSIFRHMTVNQNVEFGLRIRNAPAEERRQRSAELLDLVGLGGLGDRYADQLSGGQQQRVALARALAYRPEVLLLDEPFGALDVKIRAQLRRSLRDIQNRLKVTTILVTHDQEEAFELADRIGVIHRGRLVEIGAPQELYHRPRAELTATFIGGGNVLVGRKEGDRICLGETTLPLPADAPPHDDGAPIRILFRPETVKLRADPFTPGEGVYQLGQGVVQERLFAGPLQRVVMAVSELQGARPLTPEPLYGQRRTRIEAAVPSDALSEGNLAPGQALWLGLERYHVLLPGGLKLLIYADASSDGAAAAAFGCRLAQAAGGPVTLLALAGSTDQIAPTQQRLERAFQSWLPRLPQLETRVRLGDRTELLKEAQEGEYEIVVMGRPAEASRPLDLTTQRLLLNAGISVLFVRVPHNRFNRILICTAAGEPGKSDVRFGGRVARRTGAEAVIMHALPAQASPAQKERAQRHLEQAQASLAVLDVKGALKLAEGPALPQIVREVEENEYDLIVIGAPAPPSSRQVVWPELAGQIISAVTLPVLVVPMI